MGFLLRSAFWLGLVFNAMPWGEARLTDAVPAARDALAAGIAAQGPDGDAASSIARAVLRTALDPAPAIAGKAATRPEPSVKTRRASIDTLSAADRLAPWRVAPARSAL
ncbi:MAG TPA: hypothetical protein VEF36_16955 [Roseiarcus sp.]|nr:hypothetical protein [Roseiarcus sp.]